MLGHYARSLRKYLQLSPKELAKLARVSPKSVELLELGEPLRLEERQKIIAALYARKAKNFA